MDEWEKNAKKIAMSYRDMQYNAHTFLNEYYTFEELGQMPLKDLVEVIEYFKPKFREIAQRQEAEKLKMELAGKRNKKRPGR